MSSIIEQPYQAKTKPNFLYAIASTSFVLFLLGAFGLLLLYANDFVRHFRESVEIMVEMKDDADTPSIKTFEQYLQRQGFTRESTVHFTTKDEAALIMRRDFGNDFMAFDNNPLYNTITFNVKADRAQSDSLRHIAALIKQNTLVSDVFYQEALINNISTNLRNIGLFVLFLSLIFVFIAGNLIHNTVKLSLYSNRFLIKNMQLVGADWHFITRPYLRKSYKNGFLSALFAILALGGLLYAAYCSFPELAILQNTIGISVVFGLILLIGILISGWSTRRCINKYLRMRLDDLY
ncbi:MAG: hypothetical protein RI894_808 [Bacteroidota bacterium]